MSGPRLEEPVSTVTPRRRRLRDLKQVPVLPSLITLGNIFFGFLAIAKAVDAVMLWQPGLPLHEQAEVIGLLEAGALLVFVAMVFDALDGSVARLTNQSTPFGAQLDSLADMVAFGVAPAFLAKVLIEFHTAAGVLPIHPKLYYVAAAIYVLCAAMRLARFNVESPGPRYADHEEFRGLPSPAAAAMLCGMVAFLCTREDSQQVVSRWLLPEAFYDWMVRAMPMALVALGLLMVSRVPYPHLIYTLVRGRHSFPFLAALVVLIGVVALEWQFALVTLTLLYVFRGLALGIYRLVTKGGMEGPPEDEDGEGTGGELSLN